MSQGPHLIAAVLCDQILEAKDGTLSAIRIVDTVTLTSIPPETPITDVQGTLSPGLVNFNLLLILKPGDFRGRGKIRIDLTTPSAESLPARTIDVEFFSGEKGQNLILRGAFQPTQEGTYLFEIYFEEKLLTCSPLAVQIVQSDSKTMTNGEAQANQEEKR